MPQATAIEKLDKNFAPIAVADGQRWFNILDLGLEGQGWSDTDAPFDRLPARAQAIVRPPVWELSRHSAGICVRFVTNAAAISAKWTLRTGNLAMNHMPASGVSGLDLYAKVRGKWVWAGVGMPSQAENTAVLTSGLDPVKREYLLYLPLYNGVTSVSIGVPEGTLFAKAPPRKGSKKKGVVIYGTSITQGGCACRAGMGYPEILARTLDCNAVNLGFSGNGPMETELVRFMAELNPSVYVLDCLPNMGAQQVTERTEPAVKILREAHPKTPIVLVENIIYQRELLQRPADSGSASKNKELRAAYGRLLKAGVKGLHYVPGSKLLGTNDNLGTVDGCHPTDVGFMRIAGVLEPVVRKLM